MPRHVIPADAGIQLKKSVKWIPAFAGMTVMVILFIIPTTYARYTPNDSYQENRAAFENSLRGMDPAKAEKVRKADGLLIGINQKVCDRFEEDLNKLAAIMDEFRARKGITQTRVAYGNVNTPVEQADYWINFAAEAIAYQRAQDYTPQNGAILPSMNSLKYDLGILQGKVIKAKIEAKKALNYGK